MGSQRNPSRNELLARQAFSRLTSYELEFNEDGSPDRADWAILDGVTRCGVLEVSRCSDQRWHALQAHLERLPQAQPGSTVSPARTILAENVSSTCWGLVLGPEARVQTLARALAQCMPDVEAAGIDFFYQGPGRPAEAPELNDEAKKLLQLGVVSASRFDDAGDHRDHAPTIFAIAGRPGGQFDPGPLLNLAVEEACASNANKLASEVESHLWLWADEGTHLGAILSIGFMERSLTSACPALPPWLTKVWVAVEPALDHGVAACRVWSCVPGGAWRLEANQA